MFAVNRFVVAPNDSTRGSGVACELAERPVGCCWQRRLLLAERDCRIADSRVCAETTVIPEIAGSLILVQWLRLLGRACGAHEDHTHAYRSVIIAVYMQRT